MIVPKIAARVGVLAATLLSALPQSADAAGGSVIATGRFEAGQKWSTWRSVELPAGAVVMITVKGGGRSALFVNGLFAVLDEPGSGMIGVSAAGPYTVNASGVNPPDAGSYTIVSFSRGCTAADAAPRESRKTTAERSTFPADQYVGRINRN